jgi:hypothetical protein
MPYQKAESESDFLSSSLWSFAEFANERGTQSDPWFLFL